MTERAIIAGFGGQGVMTVGKFVASVGMHEGKHVTYFPSYGAEVRGGTAHCHLVVSDEPIFSPIVETADTLILFNQPSYDRFISKLKPDGLLLTNSSMVKAGNHNGKSLAIPATDLANEIGNVRVANIIIMGAYVAQKGIFDPDNVLVEIERELADKPKLIALNRQAFQRGLELGRQS